MIDRPTPEADSPFLAALGQLGPALLALLSGFEQAFRRLHPPDIPRLQTAIAPLAARLDEAVARLDEHALPEGLEGLVGQLRSAARHAALASGLFLGREERGNGAAAMLGAMHEHARAQSEAFPLREVFPIIDGFFGGPVAAAAPERSGPQAAAAPRIGLFNAGNEPGQRGGFSFYVPEHYDGSCAWPLLVALHGGHGHGADFLWSWLREARRHGWLLLAPTSRGDTWSFNGPDVDAPALRSMLDYIAGEWRVDRERVLLTGLSDGATYTLCCGLQQAAPFTALAPISGVLHPANLANGNLERARDLPVYLVHGALDWMFPVSLAREAARLLQEAGAQLEYRELEDLSHTYPREENARILEWARGV